MSKLRFSVSIRAPRAKVWSTMLDDATYRAWTEAFSAGSHYVGDWSQGSKILFLGPDPETGKLGGMVSRIRENRLHEYISIEHQGMVIDGQEDTTSEAVKAWAGSQENYTFLDTQGGTEVRIELDTSDEFKEMFEDSWPKALAQLKALSER